MKTSIALVAAAVIGLTSVNASADTLGLHGRLNAAAHGQVGLQHRDHARRDYTETATRTFKDGRTATRQTVQTVTDTGFERATTVTNAAGKTATRELSVTNDAQAGTQTRSVSGTTFNGKSYGHETTIKLNGQGNASANADKGQSSGSASLNASAGASAQAHGN